MNKINEIGDSPKGQYMLGRVASRANNRASAANLGTKERRKQRAKTFDAANKAASNKQAYNKGDFHRGWDDEGMKYESNNANKGSVINEIGDTPRGQYMLGRLSQSYGEPNLYSDDYGEVPEIADYASRNWRNDDNARAFELGKGDEANTKWVDDGNQRNFRKMHNLPQFENKQNNSRNMNKRLIRLTEQDLHRIVKESVNKILSEVEFRGRTFHGNRPDDWRKMANIRKGLKMDADRGEADAINGYNHSFDSQDAKEAEHWRNISKKHSKNADKNMNNYRNMGNQ